MVIHYSIGQWISFASRDRRISEWKCNTNEFKRNLSVVSVVSACEAAMPRKIEPRICQRTAYWWYGRLSTLRAWELDNIFKELDQSQLNGNVKRFSARIVEGIFPKHDPDAGEN